MYTSKKDRLDYVFLNLSSKSEIDKDNIIDLINIVKKQNPKIILSYDCLEYLDIESVIECLCYNCLDYVVRCCDFTHLEKIESKNLFIDSLHFNIDPILCLDKIKGNYSNSLKIIDYYKDMDKYNINKFYFDLYINNENIQYIHNTLKILKIDNLKSYLYFSQFRPSGMYDSFYGTDFRLETNSNNLIILDNILSDNDILIENRDYIKKLMNKENFVTNCYLDNNLNFVCIDYDFKIKLCNCIKTNIDLDPLSCFDSNGFPNEQLCNILNEQYKKYCYGCFCCEFNF